MIKNLLNGTGLTYLFSLPRWQEPEGWEGGRWRWQEVPGAAEPHSQADPGTGAEGRLARVRTGAKESGASKGRAGRGKTTPRKRVR